jgi:hypothetical protein
MDVFCRSLVARFTRSIVRCRPITPVAAEQMILDLQVLKTHLGPLPRLEPDAAVPASYTRYVTKSIGKLDTLLKVIMSPDEPPEEFVKHYLLLVPCQSFSDFQKVLDFKVRLEFPVVFVSLRSVRYLMDTCGCLCMDV